MYGVYIVLFLYTLTDKLVASLVFSPRGSDVRGQIAHGHMGPVAHITPCSLVPVDDTCNSIRMYIHV